jgi:hypothetical protein
VELIERTVLGSQTSAAVYNEGVCNHKSVSGYVYV